VCAFVPVTIPVTSARPEIERAALLGDPWSWLKTRDSRSYESGDLVALGKEGWEAVTFLPLPEPDPEGVIDTTIGYLLLKRVRL
jgi:hypothetical protein